VARQHRYNSGADCRLMKDSASERPALEHPKRRFCCGQDRRRDSKELSEATAGNLQAPKDAWKSAGDQIARSHKKNCLIRGLTPELSRDAQRPSGVLHDSATSEAAKRSRLERIVRPLLSTPQGATSRTRPQSAPAQAARASLGQERDRE
jgi:hypothetical protein